MLNNKLLPTALATAVLVAAATAQAQVEISGNVALTSDYKFRGISQSDESIALQGGFDVAFEPGFYIGTWGSTVDFDTDGEGFDGSLELDYYVGWGSALGNNDDLSIDLGFLYYDYPGDNGPNGDYFELYGSLTFQDLTVGVAYSPDYYAETDTFWYLYADYGLTLPGDFSLGFHLGYNLLEENGGFLATNEDTYIDYSVSISKEWASVEWALALVGTDLDDADVFGTEWGDDTLVFTVSKSM